MQSQLIDRWTDMTDYNLSNLVLKNVDIGRKSPYDICAKLFSNQPSSFSQKYNFNFRYISRGKKGSQPLGGGGGGHVF